MLPLCHNYFSVTPSNKVNKDVVEQSDRRKYAFGVFILLLVVVLWISSSEVTKYLYAEKHIERPFLVTYIRSSFLFIYLLVLCFTPPTRDPCRPADYTVS
ncbi:Solute carrier family 35 member F5 [Operophtera brumata]|uniref:Solute carrier family 35 member F5 n=1 Tax=Operophtera brumata TaxID=104452 RepID=A0A0L7LVA5_OPEBR|nr:Solute carrier family 35 member F5 [Operophtera brumata]